MILAHSTWMDVRDADRNRVVVIPTGSLEQHGAHLPLFTDSLIVTSVAEAVEREASESVILTPTIWLGASTHHLAFPGSLSATFAAYIGSIKSIVECLNRHGFWKFLVLNGHGGNMEPNGVAARELKHAFPDLMLSSAAYYDFVASTCAEVMEGPAKSIQHACEAETSMMEYLRADLVRRELRRNDGALPPSELKGMVHFFDEMSEEGSIGYSPLSHPEKGRKIIEAAIAGVVRQVRMMHQGYALEGS